MRLACAALLMLLAAVPAPAQFPPGRGYGRGYYGPFGYVPVYGWPPVVVVTPPVVVVQPPVATVATGGSRRLNEVLGRLPQVPPADERDILREPAPPPLPKPDFA